MSVGVAILISFAFLWLLRAKRFSGWSLALLTTAGVLTVAIGGEAASTVFWFVIFFLLALPLVGLLKLF